MILVVLVALVGPGELGHAVIVGLDVGAGGGGQRDRQLVGFGRPQVDDVLVGRATG